MKPKINLIIDPESRGGVDRCERLHQETGLRAGVGLVRELRGGGGDVDPRAGRPPRSSHHPGGLVPGRVRGRHGDCHPRGLGGTAQGREFLSEVESIPR